MGPDFLKSLEIGRRHFHRLWSLLQPEKENEKYVITNFTVFAQLIVFYFTILKLT